MMDWEDVFTAVREETGQGQLYCLGFPRIVKDIFLGNISAARVACAEMQIRRPEIEEVYLQNCVGYRLNHAKSKQKEEENTMEPKKEAGDLEVPDKCDYSKKPAVVQEIENEEQSEQEEINWVKRRGTYWWRMSKLHPGTKLPKFTIGRSDQEYCEWVDKEYSDAGKDFKGTKKIEKIKSFKKAPMTPLGESACSIGQSTGSAGRSASPYSSSSNRFTGAACNSVRVPGDARVKRVQLQTGRRLRIRDLHPGATQTDSYRPYAYADRGRCITGQQAKGRDQTHERRNCNGAELRC